MMKSLSRAGFVLMMLFTFGVWGCGQETGKIVENQEAPLHLYLLAGQSNMAGRGILEPGDSFSNPRILSLRSDMTWGIAQDPLHFDKPGIVGVGPGLTFGKAMAEADTSVMIGLIPAAVGGSSIRTWVPGGVHTQTQSRPYDDALSRTFRVLAFYGGELKGIIWHQGESDRNQLEGYEDALAELVNRFRTEFQNDTLPFVAAPLAEYYTSKEAGALLINEAILRLPERVPHSAVVSAEGFTPKEDGIHLDTPSSRELGRRYAAAMLQLQAEALLKN